MGTLEGRRAVVTGAGSGIGLAIARRFAAAGARVAVVDLDLAKAHEAAALCGSGAQGFACDVADEASVTEAFRAASKAQGGGPELLVNCAGVAHVGTLATTSADDLDRLYRINVRGTFLCMQSALGAMQKDKGGVILNMASIAGTVGLADRFAYSMTKGAVRAMTFSVAKDFLSDGIRCNCLSPARVHTPFVDGFVAKNYPGHEAEAMARLAASQPIGRMGTPQEIAELALFLCSDAASFITGQDYGIDGGFLNLR